jgi:hypothetical protein
MRRKAVQNFLVGLWVCAVSMASTYAGAYLKTHPLSGVFGGARSQEFEVKKVKPITVPIISGGALKGYIAAEFSYLRGDGYQRDDVIDPESYFMDEAFRLIYADNTIDFYKIEKFDLAVLTKKITDRVNERMGAPVLKETLVKNFTFVPREDMPR